MSAPGGYRPAGPGVSAVLSKNPPEAPVAIPSTPSARYHEVDSLDPDFSPMPQVAATGGFTSAGWRPTSRGASLRRVDDGLADGLRCEGVGFAEVPVTRPDLTDISAKFVEVTVTWANLTDISAKFVEVPVTLANLSHGARRGPITRVPSTPAAPPPPAKHRPVGRLEALLHLVTAQVRARALDAWLAVAIELERGR